MGNRNDNDRLILWGLVTTLILLAGSFLMSLLFLSNRENDLTNTAGASSAGAALLAVIGVLSLYLKRDEETDE